MIILAKFSGLFTCFTGEFTISLLHKILVFNVYLYIEEIIKGTKMVKGSSKKRKKDSLASMGTTSSTDTMALDNNSAPQDKRSKQVNDILLKKDFSLLCISILKSDSCTV
jgi:hypothetical protein